MVWWCVCGWLLLKFSATNLAVSANAGTPSNNMPGSLPEEDDSADGAGGGSSLGGIVGGIIGSLLVVAAVAAVYRRRFEGGGESEIEMKRKSVHSGLSNPMHQAQGGSRPSLLSRELKSMRDMSKHPAGGLEVDPATML